MRCVAPVTAAIVIAAAQIACSDATSPSVATPNANVAAADRSVMHGAERHVRLLDNCDPATFNAALGAGTCERHGHHGLPFASFIAELTATKIATAWRFDPSELDVREGTTLVAVNKGGETHTFTEVKAFGGGIVPLLNQLSGNTNVAPECAALPPGDFLSPGAIDRELESDAGVEHYQCCIHPWMRLTVHVHST